MAEADAAAAVEKIQQVLDPLCLVGVTINPESRVKVQAGPAPKELIEQGWRVFLVKVHNEAGVTAPLRCNEPERRAAARSSDNDAEPPQTITQRDVVQRWLDVGMFTSAPLNERLSGLPLEYRVIELFSRDRGQAGGQAGVRCGAGHAGLGLPQRSEPAVRLPARASP